MALNIDLETIGAAIQEAVDPLLTLQGEQIVWVSLHYGKKGLARYHMNEGCSARKEVARVPTSKEAAVRVGLDVCFNCETR